jgi:hypothetical protein
MISVIFAFKHDEMIRQIHLLLSYQRPGLERWSEGLLSTCLFQMHPLIPLLAVVSVYAAFRKRDITYVIVAWVVLLVLALQVRRVRYIIMVFPMLSLMASYGLMLIKDNLNARFVALSTFAFSFAIAFAAFLPFLQSTSPVNIKEAARYLDSLDIQTVRVLTPLPEDYVMDPSVSVPLLDLYTQKKISYHYEKADYPLPEDFETSRLRFTWTYKNPEYYRGDERKEGSRAVVVITDSTERELPVHLRKEVEGLSRQRVFGVRDNAYQHQTLVTVYH